MTSLDPDANIYYFLVPKNRRPRFELGLRIIDLNNVPLVNGTAFVKWRLPSSSSAEHHGHTDKAVIIDHRAYWNYEKTLQVRLTIDRSQSLHECEIHFEIIQEFEAGIGDTKNFLGRIRLNLAEYVDKSDDDEGIVRRYLMQDSKVNSTLKIGLAIRQVEGDRNFTTPPLKSAMVFGGITGVVSAEQADPDDLGPLPSIHTQSREAADMQDMYRRTLAASWNCRTDDIPADKLVEDLFAGSISWNSEAHDPQASAKAESGPYPTTGTDRKRRRSILDAKRRKDDTDKTTKDALPFMLNELETDDTLDSAVTKDRIESFRTPYQQLDKLALNDWDNLRSDLQLSFTIQQLSAYVSEHKNDGLGSGKEQILPGGTITEEWKPGISVYFETGPVSQEGVADRVATTQALRGKQLLAERILRDCWHLGIVNEVGQLDIRLPSQSLSLLLYSEHFSFEELASLHEAKIDVMHSLGLVRITGKQHPCESIREIVYDATARIREEELELCPPENISSKNKSRIFSPDLLSWVSETYGVAFEQGPNGPTKIFYLVENKQNADSARRTLNLVIYEAIQPSIPFGTYLPASELIDVYDIDPELNVPLSDRQKLWFRWAVPSAQTTVSRVSDAPYFYKHETRLSDELLKLLRATSPTQIGTAEAYESITAAVGRCLFLRKPSFEDKTINASQLGKMSPPRTFSTDIPRVMPFLHQLTPQVSEEYIQTHRIRLVPSAIYANIFPQLEIEVGVSSSGFEIDVSMQRAKAILAESNVDYLLPECGLDLRFTRKLTHNLLEHTPLEILQGSLQDLFSKSRINEGQERDPNGYTTGEYMYLPVSDIRGTRVHRYDFRGHRLNYSFYESGPFKPYRTTDVFLDMDMAHEPEMSAPDNGDSHEPIQQQFNSFYNAACSFAFDLDRTGRVIRHCMPDFIVKQ
ncbi:hypothetical protein BBP40_012716 [Aspergillus hancockii]|nr:hypothetical protein BBP40_012716 [Aspergillus hancockii]